VKGESFSDGKLTERLKGQGALSDGVECTLTVTATLTLVP